jgi:hypothetical protein
VDNEALQVIARNPRPANRRTNARSKDRSVCESCNLYFSSAFSSSRQSHDPKPENVCAGPGISLQDSRRPTPVTRGMAIPSPRHEARPGDRPAWPVDGGDYSHLEGVDCRAERIRCPRAAPNNSTLFGYLFGNPESFRATGTRSQCARSSVTLS